LREQFTGSRLIAHFEMQFFFEKMLSMLIVVGIVAARKALWREEMELKRRISL
jgi:hypothetical protein